MAPPANYYSIISLLALLQLILFIMWSSSEAASTGLSTPKSPTVLKPTTMHPAFRSTGNNVGIKIWRIENFKTVPVQEKDYGKFYTGDSYIVLKTIENKSDKSKSETDIFCWSGSESSQDEVDLAAILCAFSAFGGGPVQHKETQDHESQEFLTLFSPSIRYLPGGVASGDYKKLYHIKGKKNIRVKQVETNVTAMNKGDCFILDSGKEIYLYVGPQAKETERMEAINITNQIRDQVHAGRTKINRIDDTSTPEEIEKFFKELGSGSAQQVPPAKDDDEEFERTEVATPILYKVSDAQGRKIKIEKVEQTPLAQSHLKTDDCFILDTKRAGIYVWIGKKGTTKEDVESQKNAYMFLKENYYPAWTKVTRIIEGEEPTAFKQYFNGWKDNVGTIRLK